MASIGRRPEKILADNGPQFRARWDRGCRARGIEPVHAHPYYPQDKGKVERSIRTVNEEYIRLDRRVPHLSRETEVFRHWYNHDRFHMGIRDYPGDLYGDVTVSHGTHVCWLYREQTLISLVC